MNKILRGCLISMALFFLVGFGVIFFITNSINKSISSDKLKVDDAWKGYVSQVNIRDRVLLKGKNLNMLNLVTKSEKNIQNNEKQILLSNEYILNDRIRLSGNKEVSLMDKKLYEALLNYNLNAKEFNLKYSVFPYSYLLRKKGIDLFEYFNIEYGKDNTELINEQKRAADWIKNGGEFK